MFWSARGGAGVALVAALLVALLAVPRPEVPDAVPYPPVDDERARVELEQAHLAARTVSNVPLATDIRGVGERIRRCGVLEVSDPQGAFSFERDKLREVVLLLLQQKRSAELVQLRELQGQLLFRALLAAWSGARDDVSELTELGARLPEHLADSRDWFSRDPYFEATLRALFNQRWGLLVGFERYPDFEPTANDWRLIHRFRVLRFLNAAQTGDGADLRDALEQVAKYSPEYPYDYAVGIVHYREGAFQQAMDAFGRQLSAHPGSEWAVRAQNFRLEAARALIE